MSNWLQDMVDWIKSGGKNQLYDINHYFNDPHCSPATGPWNCRGEGGVDLGALQGTAVFALGSGQVMGRDRLEQGGSRIGGVLTQRVNVPGFGLEDIYYQHLDLLPQFNQCAWGACNEIVTKGQQIGTVSSIGETEVGFNSGWGSAWGTASQHPAPWSTQPEKMIASLMGSGAGGSVGDQCAACLQKPFKNAIEEV